MQDAVKQYATKSRECGGIPSCGAIAFGFEPTGSGGIGVSHGWVAVLMRLLRRW